MNETVLAAFEMGGAREALELAPGAEAHFGQQVRALENAVREGDPLGFDLSKGIVDTVCKTILGDHGIEAEATWDTAKLVKQALVCMRVDSDSGELTEIPQAVRTTAQGLAQAVKGLAELRNSSGTAAHGRDAFASAPGAAHVAFAARAADAIVAMMFECHYASAPLPYARHLQYADHSGFNEYADAVWGELRCGDATFPASQVLFEMDRPLYRDHLVEYEDRWPEDTDDEPPGI